MPTIFEIAAELNDQAKNHAIGRLQALRQDLKGLPRLPTKKLFGLRTTFDKYAFHVGGRTELQFNIGSETLDDGNYIRYGVAFSLEPNQTLPDIEVLRPHVARFNEFLRQYPDEFSDLRMWHYVRGSRSTINPPALIPSERFKSHTFIFLGALQSAANVDCEVILDTFDRLLPMYRYVEGNDSYPAISEARGTFIFKPGCSLKPSATTASRPKTELDIYLRHNDLQFALYRHLSAKY